MAKNKTDVLDRFASAGNDAVGLINRVDDATAKFQPGLRRGSIVKAAQGNVFEFPVFISNSIPLDYATATTSLLEQVYAAYIQMAVSINPVVSAASVKNGLQFADLKTNTNKYLEYTDTSYQHEACHNVIQEDGVQYEFNMLSIEDSDARLINEAVDYQPLSEFDHFFQEANSDDNDYISRMVARYPTPIVNATRDGIADIDRDHLSTPNEIYNLLHDLPDELVVDQNGRPVVTGRFGDEQYISAYQAYMNRCRDQGVELPSEQDVLQFQHDLRSDEELKLKVQKLEQDLANTDGITYKMNIANQRKELKRRLDKINIEIGGGNTGVYPYAKDLNNQREMRERENKDLTYTDDKGNVHTLTADDYAASQRRSALARATVDERNAYKAKSPYYRGAEAISTGARTASDVINAVNSGIKTVDTAASTVGNVATLSDRIKQAKYQTKIDKDRAEHLDEDRLIKKQDVLNKMKTSDVKYVDDSKCQKLNTMKPLLMSVTLNMLNKDDSLQPINYIIGVKTHSRVIPASILPEVAKYPLKEMDKISRKIKWRAGELKFLKDLVFRIDEKKQTAADSRDPNRKWYRRLYELAHMKGDAPSAAVVQGKSLFGAFIRDKQGKSKMLHGMIPNASIIMSQQDIDNIKHQTEIDLLKASSARKFCGELFLISLVIIDTDAQSIKILLPDQYNDYDVHSLASVEKQLAALDTSGTKTRDMFKMLG